MKVLKVILAQSFMKKWEESRAYILLDVPKEEKKVMIGCGVLDESTLEGAHIRIEDSIVVKYSSKALLVKALTSQFKPIQIFRKFLYASKHLQ